ncbi:uncharacterized protein LOC131946559 [Physella acuta]|uniref:uncharacterized protein LOC131946559 n=1 Tax=Physella acuta TaxID=109671 RepID=UPI0027DB3083|nr:uncharacterized protein LOC131946559 [Physella acuta]
MVYFWKKSPRSTVTTIAMTSLPPPISTSAGSRLSSHGPSALFHKNRSRNSVTAGQGTGNPAVGKNQPGFSFDKLSEYSRRKQETDRRKVAERELDSLNLKIDKLLSKMGETEADNQSRLQLEEECVVCLAAPATMQTFPCGHKVVCRKCLIKTIQVAVSQRCLPLRCVICRDRILRLHHTMHSSGSSTPLPPPTYPTFLTPPLSQTSRLALTSHSPACPGSLYGLHARSPRVASLPGTTIPSPTSPDSIPKFSHVNHGVFDDDLLRSSPTDLEAFVFSHNDALNLYSSEPVKVQQDQKSRARDHPHTSSGHPHGQHATGHSHGHHQSTTGHSQSTTGHPAAPSRRSDATHGFMHSQSAKIHPEATNQICSFMDSSPHAPTSASPPAATPNLATKSMCASKFISRFLPKTSRRKYNWFRHE